MLKTQRFFLFLRPLISDELLIDLNQRKTKKKLKEIELQSHNRIQLLEIDLQRILKLFLGLTV